MEGRSRTLNIPIKRSTADVFSIFLRVPEKIIEIGNNAEKSFQSADLSGSTKQNFDVPIRLICSGENYEILITISKPQHYSESLFDEKTTEIQRVVEKMKNIMEYPNFELKSS